AWRFPATIMIAAQEHHRRQAQDVHPEAAPSLAPSPQPTPERSAAVLITGGIGSVPAPTGQNAAVLSTAEIYWPAARGFWPVKAMSSSRSNHCAVLLANGGVLIMGGVQTVFAPSFAGPTVPWTLSSSDLFNSLTGQFISGPSMT